MMRLSKRAGEQRSTFFADAHGDLLDQVRAIVAEHEALAANAGSLSLASRLSAPSTAPRKSFALHTL
jgi:hypothetical protein